MAKESEMRIKINKLLEDAGWIFSAVNKEKGDVITEQPVKFQDGTNGSADYVLLDSGNNFLCVIEAKEEYKHALSGKEQARKYAKELKARFVILSNGNTHFLWDTEENNPKPINHFPTLQALEEYKTHKINPETLSQINIDENYLAITQYPTLLEDVDYIADGERKEKLIKDKELIILRDYQVNAIKAIQDAAKENKTRFLLEMATGTGKTKTCIALSKLFLETGNARRILFLVDRLELESQAEKDYKKVLKDWTTVVYKKNKSDWRKATIVISTVQSLIEKYKTDFNPTDFDLVVSDEAHRSINGEARAVFEYFVGYKLGLTATPKDYLKNINDEDKSQKNYEKRELLSTYKTFGCEGGEPTFRYDLLQGAKDGHLILPFVIDLRTEITTELLSKKGMEVEIKNNDTGEIEKQIYFGKHFEKKFFNEDTNREFCEQILEHGEYDPITGEFGKTIIFCRSQDHASKITNILNILADRKWPNKYNSDFAIQVSSNITDAQQMTINFSNNKLSGDSNFDEVNHPEYKTSKTRICVTVAMMTTGYDCADLLNVVFLRPVFSPADFIQMKGRGTRVYNFEDKYTGDKNKKERFKLFDFFAVCEYFEKDFDYNQKLILPQNIGRLNTNDKDFEINDDISTEPKVYNGLYDHQSPDIIKSKEEIQIGNEGQRVDREAFGIKMREELSKDETLRAYYENGDLQNAETYFRENLYDKPRLHITMDKIVRNWGLNRRPLWREVLDYIFGNRDKFDSKEDIINEHFNQFISIYSDNLDDERQDAIYSLMSAYSTDMKVREIINKGEYSKLDEVDLLDVWRKLNDPESLRIALINYTKDFVVGRM